MRIFIGLLILHLVLCIGTRVQAQNLLENGNFSQGNNRWTHYSQNGAQALYSVVDSGRGYHDTCLRAQINTLGSNTYDAQSIHSIWPAQSRSSYRLSFYAKCNVSGRKIRVVAQNTNYYSNDITLSSQWQEYTWDFTSAENGLEFKIHWFELGTFFINSIRIELIPPPVLPVYQDSLAHYASAIGLNLGAALSYSPLTSETVYRGVFLQQFNALVPENAMKMAVIYPNEQTGFNFTEADTIANFATSNDKMLRGHNLLWVQNMPAWFESKNWQRDSMMQFLKNYVKTVAGRYRGRIKEWDVINELVNDNGSGALRNYKVTQVLGSSIVDSVFIWAHQADPTAKLFYNDYSIEFPGAKFNSVYALVQGLIRRGVPIHGVGFQCHFDNNNSLDASQAILIEQNVQAIGALGLEVSFTEFDYGLRLPILPQYYITQGNSYANLLKVALRNRSIVKSFMLWGFTDRYSWIPSFTATWGTGAMDNGLPFGRNYEPKPAYDSLLSVLRNYYITSTSLKSNIEISIYPNPSTHGFRISGIAQEVPYRITTINGVQIESGIASNNYIVGKSIAESGIYLLQIEGRKVKTLIKK